jgi:tRNA A37 threonylcarbamoyladenosine dehydratase
MLTDGSNYKKSAYGTISYLPATFGAVAASVVIRDLMAATPR